MVIVPVVASMVSLAFAIALLVRFKDGRGLHLLAWGISMVAFAIASITVAAGIGGDWDPTLYRSFWLFGALLNVPWLAVGSISLVSPRPVALAAFALAIAGTAFAVYSVARDPVLASAFAMEGIPSSSEAWGEGSPQTRLVNYYSIVPYFIVVGIALWTSRIRRGLRPPAARVRGNILIAVGVTVVAIGGFALRRLDDSGAAFSVALALGVTVMFVGFLQASRAPRYTVADPGESPT